MSGFTLEDLFEQGRPAPHGLEIDQVLGSLHDSFGVGERPPVTLGRYQVVGRIGAGGLGIVYRAFDPSLARFVAIKVLKGGKGAAARDVRLLREAQVLARIRHPNVVDVFDVGFFEDHGLQRFFVAMELVEGTDLRIWLAAGRPVAAVCEAFVAAARGLGAAHEAGLLHRDFKPSNVLMGEDGAVKVADFGLAAVTQQLRAEEGSAVFSGIDGGATLSWRPGGTLSYMSPEQQRGEPLTHATDQYSFCISLHEAIYGYRPFEQRDREALLFAKEDGPQLRRDSRVPPAMRRLLRRGLQPWPEDRYASMEALEHALLRSTRGRRGWIAAAVGLPVVGLGIAAALVGQAEDPAAGEPSCAEPPISIESGFTPGPQIEPVLTASPPLLEAWPGMVAALGAYREELRRRWDASCTLDVVERERVQRCLAQCGNAMASLHGVFDRADRESLAQGWSLVRTLPDVHMCTPGSEGHDRGVVAAATGRARLLIAAGKLAEARAVLEELLADEQVRGSPRVRRHVEIDLTEVDANEGRYPQAREALERVYFEAASDGDARAAARASVRMVFQGYRAGDVKGALQWSRTAQTELERMQPRDYELETVLWHNLALTHLVAGDLPEALDEIRRAVEHAQAPGVSPGLMISVRQAYAELLLLNGRPAEALQIHDEQLRTRESLPQRDVMTSVVNLQSLGNALMTLHQLREAWAAYRSAYELGQAVLGPAHPNTVGACISYAWAQGDRGDPEQGTQTLGPCLERLVEQQGEDHPNVSMARAMAGRLARQRGEHEQARQLLVGALESLTRNFGGSHYAVGDVRHELGLAQAAAGEPRAAIDTLRRALGVRQAVLPEGHVNQAETMAALGRLEIEQGQVDVGEEHLHAAIEIFEARGLEPDYIDDYRQRLEARGEPP